MIPLDKLRELASDRVSRATPEVEVELRDAALAARLAEAQEQYRAAVAENVALIAQVAELKEECARLRDEYVKHCQAFAHPALSRGGAK